MREDPSEQQKELERICSLSREQAQAGNLTEALRLCSRALAIDPEYAEGYALRGQIHHDLGQLQEAATNCSAAIDRGLRDAHVYWIRAIAFDGVGRREEALADCSMALHFNPEHSGACTSRGLIYGQLGMLDEAMADFTEAIRLAPKWFLPYLHRAQTYHNRGELHTALTDYDRAIELVEETSRSQADVDKDPTLALVYCRRGDLRFDLFREDDDDADYEEARRRHPATAAVYLGEMWLRRSKYESALREFDDLDRLCPQDARGYLGRGKVHEALAELEEASVDYKAAISREPKASVAYFLRARVRHRQQRHDEAFADLSEHLQLHPADPMAYLFRSALHKERKNLTAAHDDLNAAHKAHPDHPQVCNNLAWMLATCSEARLRNGPRAVGLARQVCRATEWQLTVCLGTLAAALAETGTFDEAIRWQKEALSLDPTNEEGSARLELYEAGRPYREVS